MNGNDLTAGAVCNAFPFAAGNQGLTTADAIQNKLLSAGVQFTEHIVQQQYGIFPKFLQMDFPLRQFDGKSRSSCLTLRRKASCRHFIDEDFNIVFVTPGQAASAVNFRFAMAFLKAAYRSFYAIF